MLFYGTKKNSDENRRKPKLKHKKKEQTLKTNELPY
jgi:hypothetical protein